MDGNAISLRPQLHNVALWYIIEFIQHQYRFRDEVLLMGEE